MDTHRQQHYNRLTVLTNALDADVKTETQRKINHAKQAEEDQERLVKAALDDLQAHVRKITEEIRDSADGVDHVADGDTANRATVGRLRQTADDLEDTLASLTG